jgi:hypothetical protein
MGIESSSYSPDVVEIANDKYSGRPRPSSRKHRWVKVVVKCDLPSCPQRLARPHVRILGGFQIGQRIYVDGVAHYGPPRERVFHSC